MEGVRGDTEEEGMVEGVRWEKGEEGQVGEGCSPGRPAKGTTMDVFLDGS